MNSLKIRNWERWQTYRKDRGQPPWIKVHRRLMRDPEWVTLTDSQRGQLVSIWLLAADNDGVIKAPPRRQLDATIKQLCFMSSLPDLQLFEDLGFIELDATVTPERRQHDAPETEYKPPELRNSSGLSEAEADKHQNASPEPFHGNGSEPPVICEIATKRSGEVFRVTRDRVEQYQETYPHLDVISEIRKARQWCLDNPGRRKTVKGMPGFLTNWLNRAENKAPPSSRQKTPEQHLREIQNSIGEK